MVTPIVLGRRMKLSPLVLILALMVFGWAWGMIGLLLAVLAGVHQAGAGTPGRHAGLGTPAGMKARAGRGRMAG